MSTSRLMDQLKTRGVSVLPPAEKTVLNRCIMAAPGETDKKGGFVSYLHVSLCCTGDTDGWSVPESVLSARTLSLRLTLRWMRRNANTETHGSVEGWGGGRGAATEAMSGPPWGGVRGAFVFFFFTAQSYDKVDRLSVDLTLHVVNTWTISVFAHSL